MYIYIYIYMSGSRNVGSNLRSIARDFITIADLRCNDDAKLYPEVDVWY